MTRQNHGKVWHIDHIELIMYDDGTEITKDVVIKRLHYLNTQPLFGAENMAKGNRWIG